MKKPVILLSLILLLQLHSNTIFGQSADLDTIKNRLQRAQEMVAYNKDGALKLMEKTLSFAKKRKEQYGEWRTYEVIGFYYLNLHEYDNALEAFQNNISLAQDMDSLNLQGLGMMHAGTAYMRLGRAEKAKNIYLQALDIFKKTNDKNNEARAVGNLGNIYTQLGNGEEGRKNYAKAYALFQELGNENMMSSMNLNMGYSYLMAGQGEAALPYVMSGLEYDLKKGNPRTIAMGYGNLAYAYSLMEDYIHAFENYQHCVDTARKYKFTRIEYDTYKDMSETYKKSGNTNKAMEYLTKYYTLKDSVISQETQARVGELEVQFETAQQERQIKELRQRQRIRNLQIALLSIGLILLGVVGFFIIQKQRTDLQKKQELITKNEEIHRLEKELIEKELLQKKLEQQKIEEELAYKTSRLTDFAIDIAQKNEFSNEVMKRLDSIENHRLSKKVSDELRKFRIYVTSQLQINEGVNSFQQNVEAINLEFNRKLEQRFPDLSKKDLILCGLLRLNLQNKEIATLRNVSDNAIKMARYRLRKKLGLKAEDDIVAFLKSV